MGDGLSTAEQWHLSPNSIIIKSLGSLLENSGIFVFSYSNKNIVGNRIKIFKAATEFCFAFN